MFNFTTQTVYNSITVATDAQVKDGTVKNANLIDASANNKTPFLRIGNTRFDADDISSIEIKAPSPESLTSVTFDMSKVIPATPTEKTTGRVVLYLGLLMNSLDSLYANDYVYKGKPLYVEFPVSGSDTAAQVAARVKTIANKYFLFLFQEKIMNIIVNGGSVTFEGVSGYQTLTKAILLKYDPQAITIDCCATTGDFVDVITGIPVIYTIENNVVVSKDVYLNADGSNTALDENQVAILPGIEAFGDYNWILHNLRLPTLANQHPWSPTSRAGENPIPGQVYTQFVVTLTKDRDGIAGNAVGLRVTSVTNHVLYVAGNYNNASTPAATVYDKLDALKGSVIKTTADTKLVDPFGFN